MSRVLVVANETVEAEELLTELRRIEDERSSTFFVVAPALAVAASARANSAHGAAAALISLTAAVGLAALEGRVPEPEKLLIGALCAAAAGFIVGWSAAIFSPRRRGPAPVRRDLFLDAPLDAGR